jgi:hypothetical protein
MTPVIYVGGSKGGVGKSLVSIAIVDWLRQRGREVVFVEGDGSNSDAYLCCEQIIPVHPFDFDTYDGWNALGDLAEQSSDVTIVVNSGARIIDAVREYGHVINDLARAGVIDLVTAWPINRSKDCLRALKRHREVISEGRLGVIRNLFFGEESKFTRWNETSFAKNKTPIGSLPELSDRIVDKIYDDRMPIEVIAQGGSQVDKSNVGRWRSRAHAMFDEVLK